MSNFWHWFVIVLTGLSLVAMLLLLIGNRKTSGNETTGHDWDGITELDSPLPMWWVGMFVATIVFTFIYLIAYPGLGNFAGILGWSSAGEHDDSVVAHDQRFAPLYAELGQMDPAGLMADTRARKVGRRLYLNNCAACHGVGGNGAVSFPDLTDDEWLGDNDFNAIKRTILNGRAGIMPPWGPALGDEGVTATANYVLKLAGLPHDAARAEEGATGFATFCVACHGPEGKGNPALGAPDMTNESWLYEPTLESIEYTIRNGRTNNMPAHADMLGEERAHILAAYVKSLSQ
jgi:cytochrome c oxidase cbb3-type subunit 3